MAGVLGREYHRGRILRADMRYRLNRRAEEVAEAVKGHFGVRRLRCLDVGTADGLMLKRLRQLLDVEYAVGIDLSMELLKSGRGFARTLMSAEQLGFKDSSFDAVTAAAVIEHVENPEAMLRECHRVLGEGGLIVLTAPNPLHDKIASKIGYILGEQHVREYGLRELKNMLEDGGFSVTCSKRFMIWPFSRIPCEKKVEGLFNAVGLGSLMSNQLITASK